VAHPPADLDGGKLLDLKLAERGCFGYQRLGPTSERSVHLIRRRLQAAGLILDPRVRILRAPQGQGPDGRQLIQIRGPGVGDQAARKVGQESG
jgi:hypothetical protein